LETIKNYVSNLLMKLGMGRRTESAVYAAPARRAPEGPEDMKHRLVGGPRDGDQTAHTRRTGDRRHLIEEGRVAMPSCWQRSATASASVGTARRTSTSITIPG